MYVFLRCSLQLSVRVTLLVFPRLLLVSLLLNVKGFDLVFLHADVFDDGFGHFSTIISLYCRVS